MSLINRITHFLMPSKVPPETVIAEHAASTLRAATQTVKAILDRRAELDLRGHAQIPLVVLLGETHSVVSHHVHHMLVMDGLKKAGLPFAATYEFRHNLLTKLFKDSSVIRTLCAAFPGKPTFVDGDGNDLLMESLDPTGILSIKAMSGYCTNFCCDHTTSSLARYLTDNHINSMATDASLINSSNDTDSYLDGKCPSTASSMLMANRRPDEKIDSTSTDGIHIRNRHMVEKTLAFFSDQDSNILIHIGGNLHIVGDIDSGPDANLFKHSLAALFKESGMPVLAVPCSSIVVNTLPSNEYLPVSSLPKVEAIYDVSEDMPVINSPAALRHRTAEIGYLNPLLQKTGLGEWAMTAEDHARYKSTCKAEIEQTFQEWGKYVWVKAPVP